jgi:DNA-binding protein
MVEENTIFIGKKPLMSYVLAALRQINDDDGTVVIKARGKAISRAVDVAEILRHQFVTTATVDSIEISTERLKSDEGRESNVSSIEIFMSVPEGADMPAGDEVPEAKAKDDGGADFFGEFKDQT